uniref:Saposin A-type domain-containing protein n=1 Tax=Clastoptera arizonana TaxID=38151 RepID=A0A1B6CSE5_9HEMI
MLQFLFIAVLLQVLCCVTTQKVKTTLYYESLCPDCHVFIKDQLVPTWENMSDYMLVELVPYGNAQRKFSGGHWNFICQHGVQECEENLIHACSVDLLQPGNMNKLLHFINCMVVNSSLKLPKKTSLCIKNAKIPEGKIINCIGDPTKAESLMLSMAKRTESVTPSLYEVPTVQINGVYNPSEQDQIDKNLKSVICKYLENPQPEICNHV